MRGRGYRVDEERLKSLRVPGLVLMDVRGFRHFVVLKQVRDDVAEIGDPILGNRAIPLDEFVRAWPSRAVFVVIGSNPANGPVPARLPRDRDGAPLPMRSWSTSASPMPTCSEGVSR